MSASSGVYKVNSTSAHQALQYRPTGVSLSNKDALIVAYEKLGQLYANAAAAIDDRSISNFHLLNYVQDQRRQIWEQLRQLVTVAFRSSLTGLDWPIPLPLDRNLEDAALRQFSEAFAQAISLYKRCSTIFRLVSSFSEETLPSVLLPFELMAEPLKVRFLYHFDSKRKTNRLDKPEWFFNHITAVIDDHRRFITSKAQRVFDEELPDFRLLALHEFIRSLIPMAQKKVGSSISILLEETNLLPHFIQETRRFDDCLRNDYGYLDRNLTRWDGITPTLLTRRVFDCWVDSESSCNFVPI